MKLDPKTPNPEVYTIIEQRKEIAKADGISEVKANPSAHGLQLLQVLEATGAKPYTHNWYYQPDWGWLWTDANTFPYVYRSSTGGKQASWLYFSEGSSGPIYFYSYAAEKWETLGE